MNSFHQSIFLTELQRQCYFVKFSFEDILNSLNNMSLGANRSNRIWFSIQSFLVATGNVSKILWSKPDNQRRQELRDLLSINDNSLLKIRNFRNHFEHYDERLERWALNLVNYVDSNVGKRGSFSVSGVTENQFLRSFDPETFILHFRGDSYEIIPVMEEINNLLERIQSTATPGFFR